MTVFELFLFDMKKNPKVCVQKFYNPFSQYIHKKNYCGIEFDLDKVVYLLTLCIKNIIGNGFEIYNRQRHREYLLFITFSALLIWFSMFIDKVRNVHFEKLTTKSNNVGTSFPYKQLQLT